MKTIMKNIINTALSSTILIAAGTLFTNAGTLDIIQVEADRTLSDDDKSCLQKESADGATIKKTGAGVLTASEEELQINNMLDVAGGTLKFSDCNVCSVKNINAGYSEDSDGIIDVEGGNLTVSGAALYVGYNGLGKLTISNNAEVVAGTQIGAGISAGTKGIIEVNGGTLSAGQNIYIGYSGLGEMKISNNSSVSAGKVFAGVNGSSGSFENPSVINVESGSLSATQYFIGNKGFGKLVVSKDAEVFAGTSFVAGYSATSAGIVDVDGKFKSGGTIHIGYSGLGEMTVSNDAEVSAEQHIYAAYLAGSKGTINVNGGKLSAKEFFTVGRFGEGEMTVSGENAEVSVGKNLCIGEYSTGEMTVSENANVSVGQDIILGLYEGSKGTVNAESGTVDSARTIFLGYEGAGEMTISENAKVSAGTHISAGVSAGSTGTIRVNGGKLSALDGNIFVGENGFGEMRVLNNAEVSAGTNITVGTFAGSTGMIYVNNGKLSAIKGNIFVGENGFAEMTLSNKAEVSAGTHITVGTFAGSTGVINVNDGKLSSLGGNIFVGENGVGEMDVFENGTVSAKGSVYVGVGEGSKGTLNVYGGKVSADTGAIVLGYTGVGEMNVSGNADVSAETMIYVGLNVGGKGILNVNGGTLSSETGALYVGFGGEGEVNVLDGAVNVAGLRVNNQSALNVFGGTITVAENQMVDGNHFFVENSGTISIVAGSGLIILDGENPVFENNGKIVISAGNLDSGATANVVVNKATNEAVVLTGAVEAFGGTYKNGIFTAGTSETFSGALTEETIVCENSCIEIKDKTAVVVLATTSDKITVKKAESIKDSVGLISDQVVISAWAFDILNVNTETEEKVDVMVTLEVGENIALDMLDVFHKADAEGAEWEKVSGTNQISNLSLSDGKLSFITKSFSSYAVAAKSGAAIAGLASSVPEPSAFGLLAGAGALALAGTRRRRVR